MARRAIRFPRVIGRTYGFRTLPLDLQPVREIASRMPLRRATAQPDAISVPRSRAMIDTPIAPSPGRSYIGRTEDALNLGPVPDRIDRETPATNAGKIGRGMGGWPYDGNALYVPHQMIPRKPITVTPFARTLDTSVTIPSVAIGEPV